MGLKITLFGQPDETNKEAIKLVQLVLNTTVETMAAELGLTQEQVITVIPKVAQKLIDNLNEFEKDKVLSKLFNA